MSRIGKKPVKLADGVKANVNGTTLEVTGKGGSLKRTIPKGIAIEVGQGEINIKTTSESPETRALHGLTRSLVRNMVVGVSEGFQKLLELQGVGYRAQAKGSILALQLGFSHPVDFPLPKGISAKVDANTKITLEGADKELLGNVAARIRKIRPPEPYKGKGIRFQGEQITLKQGKAAGGK